MMKNGRSQLQSSLYVDASSLSSTRTSSSTGTVGVVGQSSCSQWFRPLDSWRSLTLQCWTKSWCESFPHLECVGVVGIVGSPVSPLLVVPALPFSQGTSTRRTFAPHPEAPGGGGGWGGPSSPPPLQAGGRSAPSSLGSLFFFQPLSYSSFWLKLDLSLSLPPKCCTQLVLGGEKLLQRPPSAFCVLFASHVLIGIRCNSCCAVSSCPRFLSSLCRRGFEGVSEGGGANGTRLPSICVNVARNDTLPRNKQTSFPLPDLAAGRSSTGYDKVNCRPVGADHITNKDDADEDAERGASTEHSWC